jgi:RNA polymerase sigma-70 factor (ECF subfamily)
VAPINEQEDDAERRAVLFAASGDVAAFELLARRYHGYVEALVGRACGNVASAEDLTQLVFLKAWQRLGTLRDAGAFRPWLRRIALNIVVDAVRSGALENAPPSDERRQRASESPEETIVRRMDVETALAHLASAQRRCIVLAYGERMSHAEIAAACNMPIGTVKSHIARGLVTLRRLLRTREGAYG